MTARLAQYPHQDICKGWIDERLLVVAECEGKIVGFAQYHPPDKSVEAAHVMPGVVRQGVGKMRVQLIEEVARNQGAGRMILGSSINATGFYEK